MGNILKYFQKVLNLSNNEVKKEIENLDTKKSSTYGSIPATILEHISNDTFQSYYDIFQVFMFKNHIKIIIIA